MEYIYKTSSSQETEKLGYDLAQRLGGCEVLALYGGLGMGKTTFTRGLAKGLGVDERDISSPTFALVHEHSGRCKLFHFDMYRIETWDDLYQTGFFDYVGTGVMVIEWSENIDSALPEDCIRIEISRGENEGDRLFKITDEAGVLKNENSCN